MLRKIIFAALIVLLAGVSILFYRNYVTKKAKEQEIIKLQSESPKVLKFALKNTGTSINTVAPWVAMEKGLFKKHNLNVEFINVSNVADALTTGAADVGTSGLFTITPAVIQGADLKWIAIIANNIPYALVSTKPAEKIKRVGITQQTPSEFLNIIFNLNSIGIKREDVSFIVVGPPENQMLALANGKIDAANIATGTYATLTGKLKSEIEGKNIKVLFDIKDSTTPVNPVSLSATGKYLKNYPKSAVKLILALKEANEYILGHRQEAAAIFAKKAALKSEKDADPVIETYIQQLSGLSLKPNISTGQNILNSLSTENPKAKSYNINNFIDSSFTDNLK